MTVEIFSIIKPARFTGPLAEECGNAALFIGRACRHHHIGMKRWLILQQDIHTAVFLLEALYGIPQRQLYTMPTYFSHDRVWLNVKITTGVYCVNKIVCRTTVRIWVSKL